VPLKIETDESTFRLAVPATGGVFVAELAEGGEELLGHWEQRGARLELSCKRRPPPPPLPEGLGERLPGIWEGVLEIGPVELRIVLTIERDESGKLGGHMVSPDQSPLELSITRVDYLAEGRLRVCIGSVFVTFTVDLDGQARQLECSYRQANRTFPITLALVEEESEVRRPQEPRPPFPYQSEEVFYENAGAGVTLAGTLTLPEGDGPFPAALLITGSGAQDRDETVFQHKPFWVIADHLSRRGVAVLRVDDRGVGGSSASADLTARDDIAGDRIGLIGHSEGGIIAPLAAVRSEAVAFVVLLAGPGVKGDELLLLQLEALGRADGMEEGELERALATQRALFGLLFDDSLSEEERSAAMRAVLEQSPDLAEGEEGEREVQTALAQLANSWVRWFLRHDPAPVLERVRCPVLAVNGTLDLQVPCQVNLEAIEAALGRGGNTDHELRAFEGHNHLFQHCETGQVSEYGKIEETFSPEVLEALTAWIHARFVEGD